MDSKLVAVLKADGYGHGALPLAGVCAGEGVEMIAVAILEEALSLRQGGVELPILVLQGVPEDAVALALESSVTLTAPSPEALEAVCSWSSRTGNRVGIHLQLDSGMNRMGLLESDLSAAIGLLRNHGDVTISGVFSHYANASTPTDPLNATQRERFERMLGTLTEAGIEPPVHHFANSAAIMTGKVEPGDWVRAGISLYGGEALDEGESRLQPVMRWTTEIARLKEIEPGEIVGYGKTWAASRRSWIATLPVGYADGYDRLLSNNGEVLVRGRRAPIVGRVSMDLTTIDVTDVPEVRVGDEVVLLGFQENESIRAEELASRIGTIAYEIFTNVSKRVPRVYTGES